MATAAKRNGGRVIVAVARIVAPAGSRLLLPAAAVDAIVFDPLLEQCIGA